MQETIALQADPGDWTPEDLTALIRDYRALKKAVPGEIRKAAGLVESAAIDHDDWIERNEIVSTNKRLLNENQVLRKENAALFAKLTDLNKILAVIQAKIVRLAERTAQEKSIE
jgi:hypothetical protein